MMNNKKNSFRWRGTAQAFSKDKSGQTASSWGKDASSRFQAYRESRTNSNRLEVERIVRDIISDKLDIRASKIHPDASFVKDLNADSLDVVELVMEFEKEFGISIPDEQAERIRTVDDAIRYIEQNR